jgi:hypothetical protein
MKKTLVITLVTGIISFALMLFFFMASTDISHDYISKTAVSSINLVTITEQLPEWTSCKSEWLMLQTDFVVRFVFMVLILLVLIKLIRNYPKQSASN